MKTVTIKDSVYGELAKLKKKDESFSKLLERLASEKKTSPTKFAGFLTKKEAEKIKKKIQVSNRSKGFYNSWDLHCK